jgi:hypothetical protein
VLQFGKYVPKEPSRIEQAYADFVGGETSHIAYDRGNSVSRHTGTDFARVVLACYDCDVLSVNP